MLQINYYWFLFHFCSSKQLYTENLHLLTRLLEGNIKMPFPCLLQFLFLLHNSSQSNKFLLDFLIQHSYNNTQMLYYNSAPLLPPTRSNIQLSKDQSNFLMQHTFYKVRRLLYDLTIFLLSLLYNTNQNYRDLKKILIALKANSTFKLVLHLFLLLIHLSSSFLWNSQLQHILA